MFTPRLLRIDKIVKDAGSGGSCPIVVEAEDGKQFILKTQQDGMLPKSVGIFNELLAYQLIDYLGFNIAPQEIVYLYIDDSFIDAAKIASEEGCIQRESFDYIEVSRGVNLGVEYLHNAMQLDNPNAIQNNKFIRSLLHIDNYVLNCDRIIGNTNILQDKKVKRKYYAIDFGSSLADGLAYSLIVEAVKKSEVLNIWDDGKISNCNVTLSGRYCLKEQSKKIIRRGRKIEHEISKIMSDLQLILDTFPPKELWEVMEHRDILVEVVARRLKSGKIFNIDRGSKCDCEY